jgi:hypothetical protein
VHLQAAPSHGEFERKSKLQDYASTWLCKFGLEQKLYSGSTFNLLACKCCTTNRQFLGSPRCRRLLLSLNSRGRELFHIDDCHRGLTPSTPSSSSEQVGICQEEAYPDVCHCTKTILYALNAATTSLEDVSWPITLTSGIRKHFDHEVIQNGYMCLVKVQTSAQQADILTRNYTSRLGSSVSCVWRAFSAAERRKLKRNSVLKRGWVAKAIESSHVVPSEGCVTDLGSQGSS